jgi:hypothetical protein
MRSGVLPAPPLDLEPAAPVPLAEPLVVVAGAHQTGRSSVVNGLLDAPTCLPVDRPATRAWLVVRHGERAGAQAFVPGRREPRPISMEALGRGSPEAEAGRAAYPPRRVEVFRPGGLLTKVALMDAPVVDGRDAATAEVLLDAAERAAGLVLVTDAAAPLRRASLDVFAAAAERVRRFAFVLTKIDRYAEWPAVLAANRALVANCGPRLADAPWFTVAVRPRGAAFGFGGLRALLAAWAEAERSAAMTFPTGGGPAVRVAVTDDSWRASLDHEVRHRRVAAGQRVSIDLATAHVRCVQELASGQGCHELPYVLDRELHALSVRASRQLDADVAGTLTALLDALLDRPLADSPQAAAVLARVTAAARRTVHALTVDDRDLGRALLVTTTGGVASTTGSGALDSLAAVSLPEPTDRVLAPIGVGLTAGCYQLWQPKPSAGVSPSPDKKDCRRWLQQALRVVEVAVGAELDRRYDQLQQVLSIIGTDAVDHGVLLA